MHALNRKKLLLSLGLFLIFMLSVSAPVLAETGPYKPSYSYVALGDSLAAGQNPYGAEKGFSYTNVVSNFLSRSGAGGSYDNFGVSGMTSAQLLDQLDPSDGDANEKMIRKIRESGPDGIITLSVGSNDILPYIIDLFIPTHLPDVDTTLPMIHSIYAAETLPNIAGILFWLNEYNPDADVFVMGFYNALVNYSDDPAEMYFLEQNILLPANFGLYSTVTGLGATFVNVYGVVTSDMLPGDIHPNKDGYRAIGEAFVQMIREKKGIN